MRAGRILVVGLTFILMALSVTAGFAAVPVKPGTSKIPDNQKNNPIPPQITLIDPKGGQKWLVGEDQGSRIIRWHYSGNMEDKFTIFLQKGTTSVFNFPGEFSLDASGNGNAWVIIPNSISGGDDYRIAVVNKSNQHIKGTSEVFSLLNLIITSPKGGEIWYKGTTHNITWTYSGNFGPKAYIWLLSEELSFYQKIGEAAIGDKYYSWKIDADIERRQNYKILITNNSSYLLGRDWGALSRGIFTVAEYVK